jgi:hypothetical protein
MQITMPRLAMTAAAIGVAAAAGAQAATPESGTVSQSAPRVQWTGELYNSGTVWNAWLADPNAPCPNDLQCDPFALKVANEGDVTVSINLGVVPGNGNGDAGLRVTRPDGTRTYATGESTPDIPFVFTIEAAEPGDYQLHVTDSLIGGTQPHGYSANALLEGFGAPPPPPAPPPSGGGGGGGGGGGQSGGGGEQTQPASSSQQPGQAQSQARRDFTITARTPRVSARRVRRTKAFTVPVTTSRAIQKLTVVLKRGRKTVGGGTVNRFRGRGNVRVKSKSRIPAGSYQLVITGHDPGVRVVKTLRLRVRR